MKNATRFLGLALLSLLFLSSCRKGNLVEVDDSYEENYKYCPQTDGNEWIYHLTFTNFVTSKVDTVTETARYIADSGLTYFYRNGNLRGYTTWYNSQNKLLCCGDRVLIDYSLLNCSGDSVLIYKSNLGNIDMEIFQHCGQQFHAFLAPYDQVKCVRTSQRNIYQDGTSLHIHNYFGHGVGLVYSEQLIFDGSGKLTSRETKKLVSHTLR